MRVQFSFIFIFIAIILVQLSPVFSADQVASTVGQPEDLSPNPSPQSGTGEENLDAVKASESKFDSILSMRDPFRKPIPEATTVVIRTNLEQYPTSSFKLLGVISGLNRLRALLLAPDGKTYFVTERMKIGLKGGIIRKIHPDFIQVREKLVNFVGEEENIDNELRLNSGSEGSGSGSILSRVTSNTPSAQSEENGTENKGKFDDKLNKKNLMEMLQGSSLIGGKVKVNSARMDVQGNAGAENSIGNSPNNIPNQNLGDSQSMGVGSNATPGDTKGSGLDYLK